MAKINLLPWRQLQRAQEKKWLTVTLLMALLSAMLIVFILNYYVLHVLYHQTHRNHLLRTELALLEKRIEKVQRVQQERKEGIAKIVRIKRMQASTTLIVRFLDELVKILPFGIYLEQLEIKKESITLHAYSQSHADIAVFIKKIEQSHWLQKPMLLEIKNTEEPQSAATQFKLGFKFKSQY